MKYLFVSAAVMLVSACSHSEQIISHADRYNDVMATIEDQMMLKNVFRAAKRRNMQFSRITSISGSLTSTLSLQSSFRAGADGANEAFFSPLTSTLSSQPSFTITPLNSKKFSNGIQTPIGSDTFELFVKQGWPVSVLISVFAEKVTVTSDDAKGFSCSIINEPRA